MAQMLDSTTRNALEERLRFYRDLGLGDFYRRSVDPVLQAKLTAAQAQETPGAPDLASEASKTSVQTTQVFPALALERREPFSQPTHFQEGPPIPSRMPFPAPPPVTPALPQEADHAAALQLIRDEIGDCTRCPLHTGRHKLVFGDGSPYARLMFVGEGPGADEDAQGLPFVGKAGQLLNNMINAMGLKREEVYIANVVKCRPPGNRVPEQDEGAQCTPFLFRQIDVVHPQVLVALGATAATWLLGMRRPLAGLRGRVHPLRGTKLIVTYHPAYLLRDPRQKKEAWADLKIAMRELGLKPPARG